MFSPDTRAMGRSKDVVWCDLNIARRKGSVEFLYYTAPQAEYDLNRLIRQIRASFPTVQILGHQGSSKWYTPTNIRTINPTDG